LVKYLKTNTMHTSTFQYIPVKVGEPMLIRIDQDDEFHHVTIGDTFLGTMEQDDDAPYGWRTDDKLLLEELPELSMALKEEKAVYNLPFALKDLFGQNIVDWDWNDDGSLKLKAQADLDLSEFADTIRNQVNEVVLFDKDVIIHLFKEGCSKVEDIHINC
jgi:hypothetical protein